MGFSFTTANRFTKQYPEEYVTEKLALTQWLVAQQSPLVRKNPAGWLRKAIEEDFKPPKDYESPRDRKVQSERQAKIVQVAAEERKKADEDHRRAKELVAQRVKANHPPEPIGESGFTTESAWTETLKGLKEKVSAGTYASWLQDTVLLGIVDRVAQVMVPSQFAVEYLNQRHYQGIVREFSKVIRQDDVDVQFIPAQPPGLTA